MDIVQNQSNFEFKKKKNNRLFYQTICMQVTKFFVSYVNNKILKKIIERGFCRATSFAKKYLSNTQVNERNQESYKLKIYLKC